MPGRQRSRPPDAPAVGAVDLENPDVALALAVGRAIFLWALDPMLLVKPTTGTVLDANPAACRVFGGSLDELRAGGRDGLRDLTDERWAAAIAAQSTAGRFVGELLFRRRDGGTFPAEVTTAVFDVGGNDYSIWVVRDVSDRHALERQLREAAAEMSRLATVDELTGLLNRRGFLTAGQQLVAQAYRERTDLYVVAADVDELKAVNDEFGHATGDMLLRDVAAVLRSTFRSADVIARVGGDEFAVIVSGVHRTDEAAAAVARLHEQVAERAAAASAPYQLSLSVGVATMSPIAPPDLEALLREADEQLYRSKRGKRRR
ncbi:MAG TPA: sensor domain-containing diguanylate cyclase [Mycobacteriales bacterium]|nr:sensor domain-containing diguanylate cyclase [Mycobacteriales bacterium]